MAVNQSTDLLFRWYQLSERERLVWASTFGMYAGESIDAAQAADKKVMALKALNIDDTKMSPEHELAKYNLRVTYADFAPWYRIAHRLAYFRDIPYRPPTDDDCAEAYEAYQRSGCDFY